jgi:hypothetical protein
MTSRDFCFWLQGLFEIANPQELNERATTQIKNHLNLVFKHEIDPSMPDPTGDLQAIHDTHIGLLSTSTTSKIDGDIHYRC